MEVPEIRIFISSVLPTLEDKNFRPLKGPVPVKDVWPIKNIIFYIIINDDIWNYFKFGKAN